MNATPDNAGVIVVTGASRGLGHGIATTALQRGYRVAACARSVPDLSAACTDPQRVLTASVDVTDEGAVASFADQIAQRFGRIDCWINNAGILEPILFAHDMPTAAFNKVLEINVTGVFVCSQVFVRHARKQGAGVLINISSGAAQKPVAGWSAYCASKAAVDRFTEVVAVEEAAHNIRAYAVAPGVVDTEMQAKIRSADEAHFPNRARFEQLKEAEAFNSPEHVAKSLLACAFDPQHRPESVVWRVPDQVARPS